MYDVFFSYNYKDYSIVETIASIFRKRGLKVMLEHPYREALENWSDALEETLDRCRSIVFFIGGHGLTRWQWREKEFGLERRSIDKQYPFVPVILPGADPPLDLLVFDNIVDFREASDSHDSIELLFRLINNQPLDENLNQKMRALTLCPYRGLSAYRTEDGAFFYGRKSIAGRLLLAAERRKKLAIIGESGSGKTSLVKAGLIPYLYQGATGQWDIISMTPRQNPVRELATAWTSLIGKETREAARLDDIRSFEEAFMKRTGGFHDIIDKTLYRQPELHRLMLIIDNWEELYTRSRDDEICKAFVNEVIHGEQHDALTTIITITSDFFGDMLNDRSLADPFQDGLILLAPMADEELAEVIEEPARKAKLGFELGLIGRIIEDAKKEPMRLPLLSFTLSLLWQDRENGYLRHETYEKIGGLRNVVHRTAESVFQRLSDHERKLVKKAFLNFARPARSRKIVPVDISFDTMDREAIPPLEKFINARLVYKTNDVLTGKKKLCLVHEILMHKWDRFRMWIDGYSKRRLLRTWMAKSLSQWENKRSSDSTSVDSRSVI